MNLVCEWMLYLTMGKLGLILLMGLPCWMLHQRIQHIKLQVGKRCRTTRLERRIIDSAFQEFRVDCEQTKHFPNGKAITSDTFCVGGYIWRVHYFPHGAREADKGFISLLFELMSKENVNIIFFFVKLKQ